MGNGAMQQTNRESSDIMIDSVGPCCLTNLHFNAKAQRRKERKGYNYLNPN